MTFYNRVNSCDLNVNVNVNSCIQSLTSLNVNGNVNDSKIVNSMSIVNVNTSKKSMSMAHTITLLMSDLAQHLLTKGRFLARPQVFTLSAEMWDHAKSVHGKDPAGYKQAHGHPGITINELHCKGLRLTLEQRSN